ncbi:MAG: hypothetical protein AAFY71_11685 [Bacteroidota bacterium]
MKCLLQIVSLLSLDVVLGSLASGMMILYWKELNMPLIWWCILPLAVWVVYTADHLLDAYRLKDQAHTDRHLFHHLYFRPLAVVWGMALLLAAAVLPFFLTKELILFGFGMGGLVLIHLFLVWIVGNNVSTFLQKELGVGLIYALGIWGGPFAYHKIWPEIPDILIFLQFFILAMMNLLTFSMYDEKSDSKDGQTSFVRAIGIKKARQLVRIIGILVLLIGLFLGSILDQERLIVIQGLIALMGLTLLIISEIPAFFSINKRYRFLGDGIFLLPLVLFPFL